MANANELIDNRELDPISGLPPCGALLINVEKL